MSKIEKALNRARQADGKAMVLTVAPRPRADDSALAREAEASSGHGGPPAPIQTSVGAKAIARMKEAWRREPGDLAEQRIIAQENTENPALEAFRELRTRILQHTKGRNGIILVTSVVGNSGNTFAALNLGAAFALDAGRTALVVDCNLRRPSLQRFLGDQPKAGIADFFENPDMDVANIVHPLGIERLRVVPAGAVHDGSLEYFTSQRAQQLLLGLRNRYSERFVILDAPPMSESADTQILTGLCDHILVVVPYGRVSAAQIDACLKALDGKKLLGVIFNDEPTLPALSWRAVLHGIGHRFRRLMRLSRAAKNAPSPD